MATTVRPHEQLATEEVRRHVREMWAAVAEGWARHADFVEERGKDVTQQMLDAVAPRRGEHVLELASGAGDVGLAAAPLVTPGEVVVSDVAAEMTAIATRRAAARGLHNVTTRTFGLEAIDADDASFDIALCREGLMFAAEPAAAVREIARVLRPSGRVAVAVWGPRTRNPWLGVVFETVSEELGRPVPPPGFPNPFALADATSLARLFETNGFEGVSVRPIDVPLSAPSFDEWWDRVAALAGPLTRVLASLPEASRRELRNRLREAVRSYETRDGLHFPGQALLASGRRPDRARTAHA
jgi:ubiquinone/menaquinone biosynthesis C-methylase UbiE